MSDKRQNFQEFSIKSSLFKGRYDWFFCFLKAERIAHVLSVLVGYIQGPDTAIVFEIRAEAEKLPGLIARMAAGIVSPGEVLAEVYALSSKLRLLHTRGLLTKETTRVLLEEFELLSQRLDSGLHKTPLITADDFTTLLPDTAPVPLASVLAPEAAPRTVKDIQKGHSETMRKSMSEKTRKDIILTYLKAAQKASIKDIRNLPDPAIRACSEKTIQRELHELIQQGLIQKTGERRWSQYSVL